MAIAKYAKTCSKNTPGNPFLAYTEVANVTSVTIAAGEITAITAGAAAFKEFDADIDFTKMTLEGTGGSSFFQNNKIEAKFSKLSIALVTAKESLVDAVNCGALAIKQMATVNLG